MFLEFFAGKGNTWRLLGAHDVSSLGIDIEYYSTTSESNPFDILSTSGLA